MYLHDRQQISSERRYTEEGFLQVPARISRSGIQDYLAMEMGLTDRDPTDIVRVYRPEDEVFAEESMASFASKPVTDNHPPELVNSRNAKQYQVGMSGPDVRRDGMFVTALLNVTDAGAIDAIESGKVELSNGYTADIEWTAGVTPDGQKYDAIQRNIKGNHIAIVERGRAGPCCRVADTLPSSLGDEVTMAKIHIDGVDYEVPEQAAQAVGKLQQRLNDTESTLEEKDEELKAKDEEQEEKEKEAQATKDSLQAKLDDALAKIPSAEQLDIMVADRIKLVDTVKKVAPEIEWAGKDSIALISEVVASKCPSVQMDSVSADYLKARFDMLVEAAEANPQGVLDAALRKQVEATGQQTMDTRPASVKARERMMEDSQNAWKTKGA